MKAPTNGAGVAKAQPTAPPDPFATGVWILAPVNGGISVVARVDGRELADLRCDNAAGRLGGTVTRAYVQARPLWAVHDRNAPGGFVSGTSAPIFVRMEAWLDMAHPFSLLASALGGPTFIDDMHPADVARWRERVIDADAEFADTYGRIAAAEPEHATGS